MPLSDWVGSVVSIDCGEVLGTYQGHVSAIDQDSQSISISKGFRNGIVCPVPLITINAMDIRDLKIISSQPGAQKVPVVCIAKSPRQVKTPVDETTPSGISTSLKPPKHLTAKNTQSPSKPKRHTPTNQSHNGPSEGPFTPSKHTSKQENGYFHGQNGFHDNSAPNQHRSNGTPTKWEQGEMRRRTNSESESRDRRKQNSTPRKVENGVARPGRRGPLKETTFSAPMKSFLDDFDFEKNLALFDKQAVFEEIENSGFPKIVKACSKPATNYRYDENVINSAPVEYRQITVPHPAGREYVADSGLVVPSVTYELRRRIFEVAEDHGLSTERQMEMIGRSASEMVMQLLGGSHRLTPKNAHQRPQVVVLCGPHYQGAMGVNCARQLATHNISVVLFVPNFLKMNPHLESEIKLFELADGNKVTAAKDLPGSPVDMVINTIDSHENKGLSDQAWYKNVVSWVRLCKASVLAIDPPVEGGTIDPKWSVGMCLPLALSERCGQVYLADMGIPVKVFSKVGIRYQSPFGHKFCIALHPKPGTTETTVTAKT